MSNAIAKAVQFTQPISECSHRVIVKTGSTSTSYLTMLDLHRNAIVMLASVFTHYRHLILHSKKYDVHFTRPPAHWCHFRIALPFSDVMKIERRTTVTLTDADLKIYRLVFQLFVDHGSFE